MIDQPQSNNDFQHKAAEVSTANIAWLREGRDVIRLYQSPTNAIPNDALLTVGSESSFLKFVRNPGVMMVPNMHHKSPPEALLISFLVITLQHTQGHGNTDMLNNSKAYV